MQSFLTLVIFGSDMAAQAQSTSLSRVERKRIEARARIVDAAARLMRERGVEAVTINDITSAADVGHGSFYLHFKSKHEVLLPIMKAEAAGIDERLQSALEDVSDPAEFLAASARYMGYTIARDELWRWFLSHSGVPSEDMRLTFGSFSERDYAKGLASGRFQPTDPRVTPMFGFGGFVSVLLASFDVAEPERMIDQAVEILLRVLGLDAREAAQLATKPLPSI